MAKKKSKKTISPSMFKVTGTHAKMKTVKPKEKLYYFVEKINADKAKKLAAKTGAEILDVSESSLKVSRPSLKYDFYCIYEATLDMKFVRVNKQELGVLESLKAAMVGKEVLIPKKGKDVPGKAIFLDVVELFEMSWDDSMVLDGTTGIQSRTTEKLLKGAGKKKASSAFLRKAKITSGKMNAIAKVIKAVQKAAGKKPKEAKRVVAHTLTFKKLEGYYVPTYYVNVSYGEKKKTIRVNAVNKNVALKV
jgi:hypothetical protein